MYSAVPVTGITPAELFNGVFQVDTLSCVPSDTCCCGVGQIGMTPQGDNGVTSTILMTGQMDGGTGCYGLRYAYIQLLLYRMSI